MFRLLMKDDVIDRLIKKPVQKFEGIDWSKVRRSTGAGEQDRIVAERYTPSPEEPR